MSQKRQSEEDGEARSEGNSSDDKRRRVPKLRSVFLEWMKIHSLQHSLEPVLEPLIRRVVREEVELVLSKHLTCMKCKEVNSPEFRIRNLLLQFTKGLSLPVFTGARIEGEESSTLQIALFDALTAKIVDSGPESSARVEVIVLEGDFDGGDWTPEEFKNNIVREREGKKPLITGDSFLILKEGIGLVGDVSFTDNSSWTRSRRFRLGARVVDNNNGSRVKEAKTEPFVVRDHRGELYKKHHPPSLLDEVWRLEKIGKDGAFHKRLIQDNISTVKDFLTTLFIDSGRLRNILGTGMSAKMWEVMVEHAQTCVLDKKVYLYHPPDSPQQPGVVFNVVGQLMGLLSECQYVPLDMLSETQKVEAQHLITSAFGHWDEVVSLDSEASLTSSSSDLAIVPCTSSYPSGSKNSTSPDIIYSIGGISSLDDFTFQGIDSMNLSYDQTLSFPGPNSAICNAESVSQAFCDDEHLQYFDANTPQSCSLESVNASIHSAGDDGFVPSRSVDRAKKRWRKIISVLKWFSLLASKRKASR